LREPPHAFRPVTSCLILILSVAWIYPAVPAQSLRLEAVGDSLRIKAPQLRFIEGRSLDRLRDGGSVIFAFELQITSEAGAASFSGAGARFNVSYDLWEEWFAVSRIGEPTLSISRLSAEEAEAWCLDNLALDAENLGKDEPFWVTLSYRAEIPAPGAESYPFFSLERLIDLLSRSEASVAEGRIEAGPFRLSDLD
jgi:hypothetical protein